MTNAVAGTLTIYQLSEYAVTIEFGYEIAESLINRIGAFGNLIRQNPFPGFQDVVTAYTTLTIFFDPVQLIYCDNLPGKSCFEKLSAYLESLNGAGDVPGDMEAPIVTIPVCYDNVHGPDLEFVAGHSGLTQAEVIQLHSEAIYTVYMIGFLPGFAYMGIINQCLETPRKESPRRAVPAGSVGIAGKQTGIYPLESPGGWQIIGQTPVKLFDANREKPALLKAGDRVQFVPVTQTEFENYQGK